MPFKWTHLIPRPLRAVLGRQYYRLRRSAALLHDSLRLEVVAHRLAWTGDRARLKAARAAHAGDYPGPDSPLITVMIATYNRAELLVSRTLPSVLEQTYQNFEIVVVGDGCTDDTAQRIAALGDSRIRFYNLPERGHYPADPVHRWMVAGVYPINRALDEARGLWIAHLDDDDVFKPFHLERLLAFARQGDYELVFSQMRKQSEQDYWVVGGADRARWLTFGRLGFYRIPHSACLFRTYLRLFRFDPDSWRINAPADGHAWVRMHRAGVRFGFWPEVTALSPLRPGTTLSDWRSEDRD